MIRTIRARSVLLFCALLFWMPQVARAGKGNTRVHNVHVTTTSDWSAAALKGYQPVRVELVNESSSPRSVQIILESDYGRGDVVTQRFALEARGRLTAEMIVPTFALSGLDRWAREYSLRALSGGKVGHISGVCGEEGQSPASVMVFTRGRLQAGKQEVWAAKILGLVGEEGMPEEEDARAEVHRTLLGKGGVVPELALGCSLFEFMPSRHEAYSSLDCVVVDLSRGAPASKQLEPLLAYARLGGKVVLLGEGAIQKAQNHELLSPLMEERFRETNHYFGTDDMELRACGLGKVLVVDTSAELFNGKPVQKAVKSLATIQNTLVPSQGGPYFRTMHIPGVDKLPYKVFVGLLILFAILIGPVNFVWVKRTGKPALLLLTIPLISLAASLLLLSYGVLYQGLDTKSSSTSLAILDQRAERVDVIENRYCFVGLATEVGLQPAAGTACFPMTVSDPKAVYAINVGESNVLSAAFFQSRIEMDQRFLSERTSRLRLVVEPKEGGLHVTNGFTCGLTKLVLRDAAGEVWKLTGGIAKGASAELEHVEDPGVMPGRGSVIGGVFDRTGLGVEFNLYEGSYYAQLDENIFQDDCGLEMNELAGRHGVVGILDLGDFR